jgi:hypothetical protein
MGIVGATSEAERDCGTLEEGQSHMGALRISVLQVMTLICYYYTELKGRGEEEKERGGWERRRRDEAMRGVEVRGGGKRIAEGRKVEVRREMR